MHITELTVNRISPPGKNSHDQYTFINAEEMVPSELCKPYLLYFNQYCKFYLTQVLSPRDLLEVKFCFYLPSGRIFQADGLRVLFEPINDEGKASLVYQVNSAVGTHRYKKREGFRDVKISFRKASEFVYFRAPQELWNYITYRKI
jgi:hypothetical protein